MPTSQERAGRTSLVRRILFVVIAVLTLLTAYQWYRSRPDYQLHPFERSTGWGYDVLNHGNLIIHQPVIPGVSGERGFVNEAQARRVGERVIRKLRQGKGMPSVSQEELRTMQIVIP